MENRFLTVEEAAALLRVSKATIYDWKYKKKITSRKHGSRLLFCLKHLLEFSKSQETLSIQGPAAETSPKRYIEEVRNGPKRDENHEIFENRDSDS
jgi:excisionase family DNA binding protein